MIRKRPTTSSDQTDKKPSSFEFFKEDATWHFQSIGLVILTSSNLI